jgi:IstB-like ATP binding protein
MLHQPTIEKLLAMRMQPMVETWRSFEQDENAQPLSFEEKLSLMVDRLWTWRQTLALERRLRYAKLWDNACVEDIDYRASRGLDRSLMSSLANDSGWVQRHAVRRHLADLVRASGGEFFPSRDLGMAVSCERR